MNIYAGFVYTDEHPNHDAGYVWPEIARQIAKRQWSDRRAIDIGCGNGWACGQLNALGFQARGIDESRSGIEIAKATYPDCQFAVASAYEPLAAKLGTFRL